MSQNFSGRAHDPRGMPSQLTPEAIEARDVLCRRTGIPKKELVSRLVLWAARLDATELAIALDQVNPADAGSLARMVLARVDPAEAVAAAVQAVRKPRRPHPPGKTAKG